MCRTLFDEAFERAVAGAEFVVPGDYRLASLKPDGWKSSDLRTRMHRPVRRAGLPVWPKPFQALWASLETDPTQDHPVHVVWA